MFRKFQDRISNVASSVLGNNNNNNHNNNNSTDDTSAQKISALQSMGYTYQQATNALQATNGNVDQAAELLLLQSSSDTTTTNNNNNNTSRSTTTAHQNYENEEEQIQRIMQESFDMEHQRQQQQQQQQRATGGGLRPHQTAAMSKAAVAAERRSIEQQRKNQPIMKKKTSSNISSTSNTGSSHSSSTAAANTILAVQGTKQLIDHHPDVKIIPKLQDKSKEEQIIRCVDRMKNYPNSVDSILRILKGVQQQSNNSSSSNNDNNNDNTKKYRILDTNHIGYKNNIQNVPGAEGLLMAMNYRRSSSTNQLILDISMIDIALLYLGISALEQVQMTLEYKQSKQLLLFRKEVDAIINSIDNNTSDAIIRSQFLSQCPTEPMNGRGAFIQIKFATPITAPSNNNNNNNNTTNTTNTITHTNATNTNNNAAPIVFRRRFDGDDTLQDVLNYIGAMGGNQMYNKLVIVDNNNTNSNSTANTTHTNTTSSNSDSNSITTTCNNTNTNSTITTIPEWVLVDLNQYPCKVIDCTTISQRSRTLQYIGCWPSGKLEVRPNPQSQK